MFSCISKKYFSSKLYANVANLQKLKTIKLTPNKSVVSESSKSTDIKANSNNETYIKAYSNANQNIKQAKANERKLEEIEKHINESFLKKANKVNYENYQLSAELAVQSHKKPSMGKKDQQEIKSFAKEQDYIINSLKEYGKTKSFLAINNENIADCKKIMDLAAKLNNEKYSARAADSSLKKPASDAKDLLSSPLINKSKTKLDSEKFQNINKQTVLKNAHLYELYYYTIPFANQLLSPHKYREAFGTSGVENFTLKMEFEHEQDCLNSEVNAKLEATVENEMKGFKLSHIKSNVSLFKDPIKNLEPIGYLMEESNRLVDFDAGIELERLFYVINKEDDFGATMYKEEGDKKKPKETSMTHREDKEDLVLMRTTKHFPFTVDGKAFTLAKNSTSL